MTLHLLDASHYQPTFDTAAFKAAGVVGVIHKATQMMAIPGVDASYQQHKAQCLAAGLLWGAYLFFDPTDGIKQADYFLDLVGTRGDTAIFLDLEEQGIILPEIEACIKRIHDRTNIWTPIYTAPYVIDRISGHNSFILGNCRLWVAGDGPVVPSPWSHWWLWQSGYSNFGNETFDLDEYEGTLDDLKQEWALASPTQAIQQLKLQGISKIPWFKTPGGELGNWDTAGDTVSLITGSQQVGPDGILYIDTPDDHWHRVDNIAGLNLTPTPPVTPVDCITTAVLNVRDSDAVDGSGNPLGKIEGQFAQGATVQELGVPSVVPPYMVAVTGVTKTGLTVQGFSSSKYLSPKA